MQDRNWLAQQLDLLMTGVGYNLYNNANRARADDLLVRQHAGGLLGETATLLSRLATDYTAQRLPPSTRDHPFPTAAEMAPLNELQKLRAEVTTLSSRIRGLSVPTQDRVWERFRNETTTLHFLLSSDYQLIMEADAVLAAVKSLTALTWNEESYGEIRGKLDALEQSARDREQFLKTSA
jgi:hypothetical protein